MRLFERCLYEGSIRRGEISVISFIINFFPFLYCICPGDWFYNRYINSKIGTKYTDDNGTGVTPK